MNSGRMVERRDQVRITFFSLFTFRASTFFIRWSSTNGPLCSERPIWLPLLRLPSHDELIRSLVVAGLESARRLAPRSHRMAAARGLAFAAAVRMVHRIHRHPAVMR